MSGKKILYVFTVFVVFLSVLWIVFGQPVLRQYIIASKQNIISSPLPDSLSILTNKEVVTLDLWQPIPTKVFASSIKTPDVNAQAAFVYDMTTNKVTFAKNETENLPMASLTKVMTAIIALENQKPDDQYLVTKDDLVGEDSLGVTTGETYSLKELLYGLFLRSGNDTAEVIASNYPFGRAAFIQAMNDKALSLGLTHTHFTNPTGLEGDGQQYTTAYDLLVITQYGLTHFPLLNQVAATFDYHIPYTKEHKEYYLENETNLISSYPGVKGIKTGFTPEAGLCLITYLDYKEHKIIGVILHSDNRRGDMIDLLDYSLKIQGITPPAHGSS